MSVLETDPTPTQNQREIAEIQAEDAERELTLKATLAELASATSWPSAASEIE